MVHYFLNHTHESLSFDLFYEFEEKFQNVNHEIWKKKYFDIMMSQILKSGMLGISVFHKFFDHNVATETRAHNCIAILPLQPICNHLMTFKGYLQLQDMPFAYKLWLLVLCLHKKQK